MNKSQLRQAILERLEDVRQIAVAATRTAIDSATSEETVPEHKYDTLALEAAYLAHGQAQRLAECEQDILLYRELVLREFDTDSPVAMSALVELTDESECSQWYFIGPAAGGTKLEWQGQSITLLTPNAPLAVQLMGKLCDDEVTLTLGEQSLTYFIEQVM